MARIGGRAYGRWRVGLGVVGVLAFTASVLYAVVQLANGDLDASDTAGLLGLPVGVAALVVSSLVGMPQPPRGDAAQQARGWASTLAEQVKEDGQQEWRQLIGDDTQMINLTFTLRAEPGRAAAAPADAGCLAEGTPALPDVASYFRRTYPRRLVVTGAPGAGKTVLALELMLALIEGREEGDPVPVRLSLSEWDTTVPLLEWLARHLVDVYDWPAKMAEELIRQRHVLPVLDGLDEMDPTAPGGAPSADAPRAQAALEALNAYQNGRAAGPVILTCRTHHYEALHSGARLLDAARIDIDHITPATARTYLLQRAPDPARWQPVLDALVRDPTGTLATTLSTPWRLGLAATVYARHGDPAGLLHHATPADLDAHLLARFVTAATLLHPLPRNSYAAGDVHRWLAHLAAYLNSPSSVVELPAGSDAGPRTDLVLHQLWPLAGLRRVRAADAALTALVVLLPILLAWAIGIPLALPVFLFVPAAFVAGIVAVQPEVSPPARVHWGSLRTKAGYRGLMLGVLVGASMLLLGFRTDFQAGFAAALVCAVSWAVFVVVVATVREPPMNARPRDIVRSDLLVGLANVLGSGSAVGAVVWVLFGVGPTDAFLIGLAFGLMVGVGVDTQSGRRYLAFLLCSKGKLPMRLGAFLDWACVAGLLRLAGTAYQFRHRELQQWLARHPEHPPV